MKKVLSLTLAFLLILSLLPTAAFAEDDGYTVTLSVSPAGSGSVSGAGIYSDGDKVKVSATAYSGWRFDHWQADGHTIDDIVFSFVIHQSAAYEAVFVEDPTNVSGYTLEVPNNVTIAPYAEFTTVKANVTKFSMVPAADGKSPDFLQLIFSGTTLTNQSDSSKTISFGYNLYQSTVSPLNQETFNIDAAGNLSFNIIIPSSSWNSAVPGTYTGTINYALKWHYDNGSLSGDIETGSISVKVTIPEPTPEYTVTVINGTADNASAAADASITITADDPPAGQQFKAWEGADDLTFTSGSKTTLTATFTMPAEAVTVTATYEDIPAPTYTLTVNNGTGGGEYTEGATVTIMADNPPAGQQFKAWEGTDDLTFTSGSAMTAEATFTMPAQAATVTATYKDIPASATRASVADGFYLIGPEWNIDSLLGTFSANPANAGEYMLATTLSEGQKIKVVYVENGTIKTWYPDGQDNEYNIDAAHSGNVTVYFNPHFNYTWNSFIRIAVNHSVSLPEASELGSVRADLMIAPDGTTVTLTVTPATGCKLSTIFAQDSNGGTVPLQQDAANENQYTFTMPDKNVMVEASFEKIFYHVNIPTDIPYGTVTANVSTAKMGDTVILTVSPDPNCVLESLTVTDAGNNSVTVTDDQFIMPPSDVTITASFRVDLDNGYYLVDLTTSGKQIVLGEMIALNTGTSDHEYMLQTTLYENQKLKVVRVENGAIAGWYPDGFGNEYTVPASLACSDTVFFRPYVYDEWLQYPYGGGGYLYIGRNYAVNLVAENGTITADYSEASRHTKVTVTIVPNEDCTFSSISAADSSGEEITLTQDTANENKYTFIMGEKAVTVTAIITKNVHTVTIVNGTADPASAAAGESVTITADDPQAGQRFKAWDGAADLTFTSGSTTDSPATFTMPMQDVSLTATYEAIPTYTVTFDPNVPANASTTYSGNMDDQVFECDEKKPLSLNDYSLPGYDFGGWNEKADGTGKPHSDNEEVEGLAESGDTVTLYAQWTAKTYTITFKIDEEGSQTHDQTAYFDQPGTLDAYTDAAFSWNSGGKTLEGWLDEDAGSFYEDGEDFCNLCGSPDADGNLNNVTLIAEWVQPGQIIVAVTKDGTPQKDLQDCFTLSNDGAVYTVPLVYENGEYVFDTTNAITSGTPPSQLPAGEYDLQFSAIGYPSASTHISYSDGNAVGVVFDFYTVSIAMDSAYAEDNEVKITGGEPVTGESNTVLALDGSTLEIETTLAEGYYRFVNYTAVGVAPKWEDDDPSKPVQEIVVQGKADITAHVEPIKYSVSVVNGTADKATAALGETVTITADEPASGESFVQWAQVEGVSYSNASSVETTFSMPAKDVTVAAVYAPIVIGLPSEMVYTGEQLEPEVSVSLEGVDLALTTEDYEVSFDNNVDAGDAATVTVKMKAPRAGSATATFQITPADIGDAIVTAADQEADGTEQRPVPTVTWHDIELQEGKDYEIDSYADNVQAGTATVTVKGKGNFKGTASGTFKITEPIVYTVTGGADSSWYKDSGKSVSITVKRSVNDDECFAHYTETLVDGKLTTVTAKAGSTIVTFSPETLGKLSTGKHTVTVKFDDGEVTTNLTIKVASTDTPPTGDNSQMGLWIVMMCLSGAILTTLLTMRRKKRAKN